ncbi:MAG: hypothetical protein H5U19_03100 [Rhodobacteraceae bacterium]|nr:hypothetical protein [Paracoccaceae bacterium]
MQLGKVLLGLPDRLQNAFTHRDRRHDDDELGQAIAPGKRKDSAKIDIGFARAGFHFDRKVREPHLPLAVVQIDGLFDHAKGGVRLDACAGLHLDKVFQHLFVGQVQGIGHNSRARRWHQRSANMPLPVQKARYRRDGIKLELLRPVEPEFRHLQHLQGALQRKVGGNGIVKRRIAAHEQVRLGQAKALGLFKVDVFGQADSKGAVGFRVGHTPRPFRGRIARRGNLRRKRETFAQGNFPNHVFGLPSGQQRVGKRFHLRDIAFGRHVLGSGPTANVGCGQAEGAEPLWDCLQVFGLQHPAQPFAGHFGNRLPTGGKCRFACAFLGVHRFGQLHGNELRPRHSVGGKSDHGFGGRT